MQVLGACLAVVIALLVNLLHAVGRDHEDTGGFPVTFTGTVTAGQRFEHRINDEYLFVLQPQLHDANPPGWTIQVVDPDDHDKDYVWVVTPSFRFQNPRYLDTGYGLTPEQAVAWTPRKFNVLRRTQEFEAVVAAIRAALWSAPASGEPDDAVSRVENAIAGAREAELHIESFSISSDRIERLSIVVSIR